MQIEGKFGNVDVLKVTFELSIRQSTTWGTYWEYWHLKVGIPETIDLFTPKNCRICMILGVPKTRNHPM
jgi:hypothetical protein